MKNTRSSIRIHRLLALLLALMLATPALAEDQSAGVIDLSGEAVADGYDPSTDLSGGYVPSADMQEADVVIGYVAPAGSLLSPVTCTEWALISLNQLIFESVLHLAE